MCKTARSSLIAMAFGALLALPLGASAVTFEDSFDDCNYPKMVDLLLMRPLSMVTLAGGTLTFMGIAPLGFATVPADMGEVYDILMAHPARFTFNRPLGECQAVELSY